MWLIPDRRIERKVIEEEQEEADKAEEVSRP
jgi:hypothetical protein